MNAECNFNDILIAIKNWNLSTRFKAHSNISSDLFCHALQDDNVTYLDFKTWRTLYLADQEHWSVLCQFEPYSSVKGLLPMYIKDGKYKYTHKSEYLHYIKFLKKRDYRKWEKFIVKLFKTGHTYANTKEILMLSEIARKRAEEKAAETHAKTQQAYEEVIQNVSEYTKKILSWGDNK